MKAPALVVALATLACQPARRPAPPASRAEPVYPLREAADGLWFMELPGSEGKATVVELADAVVLVEVPVRDEGGGAQTLTDDLAAGERILRTLRRQFPDKPLRYVLASHWHPHSLSALQPFLDAGITIVTTRGNFARLETMLKRSTPEQVARLVRFVDDEPLVIGDASQRIVVHRAEQAKYPSMPTTDYLFFELPRYGAVHSGCMYNKWDGGLVAGREFVTRREEDLHAFLGDRKLTPQSLIRYRREPQQSAELLPYDRLDRVVRTGIRARDLAARYRDLSLDVLRSERARIVAEAIADNVPPAVINGVAYERLSAKDLPVAVELAVIQVLISPSNPNAWDSLGEIHYAMGNVEVARTYERAARTLDPRYTGGEAAWKATLEELRRTWAKQPNRELRAPAP